MMDLQTQINNMMTARRADEMKNSDQLMLGELILKLEAVKNKELPIFFDREEYQPTGLTSWRGSYAELSITYEKGGGSGFYEHKEDCPKDKEYDYYTCECESIGTSLENATAKQFLEVLKKSLGKVFTGYKGGDFVMGKNTPVWVANYGTSSGFDYKDEDIYNTKVIDITEENDKVIINTKGENY